MLVSKRLNYVRTPCHHEEGVLIYAHFAFIQNFKHTSGHNRHRSWSTVQLILVVNRSTEILCSYLTFICQCIANIFAAYNQQDATFHSLFISVRHCICFRRVFRPSSGAQNCTYSVRYLSDQHCNLLLAWTGCSILSRLAAGCSIGLTNTLRCMCSFELLMMDGNPVWNMYSVLHK
jgi:hypothetical protein